MNKPVIPWKRKTEVQKPTASAEHPLLGLHRQMNDLFEGFFRDFGGAGLPARRGGDRAWEEVMPRIDVAEAGDAVQVTAELPGMDEKDIEVTLEGGALTIRGEKKQEREEKKKNYYFSERSYGSFHRVLPLPEGIDESKVKAQFKKGVLTVSLPRTERAKSRQKQIPIARE